jgi:hypothetical protein
MSNRKLGDRNPNFRIQMSNECQISKRDSEIEDPDPELNSG